MAQKVVIDEERIPRRDYEEEQDLGANWLPLLIIPLLLGGLLWGLQSYSQNTGNPQNSGEQQFGIGGAPMVTESATPTLSPTATPTTTPTPAPTESEVSPTDILDDVL